MTRSVPAAAALLIGLILLGETCAAQAYCPWSGRKVVYDEFGYAAPAPCERVAVRGGYTPCAAWSYSGAVTSCYPPLRPAAGFDPFDRPREMSWSW